MGQNLSRWLFADPTSKKLFQDWDYAASMTVRGLRQRSADDPDDPRLLALVSELSSASERFRQLWEQADVGLLEVEGHVRHPEVGDLYLTRTQLDLPNTGGAHIITWHAPPNSTSAHALDQLRASLPNSSVPDR